jgi:hypothetical protein
LAKIDFGNYGTPILNHLDLADDQLMGPAQMGTGGDAAEISCPTFPLRSNHNRRMRRAWNHCLRVRLAGPLFVAFWHEYGSVKKTRRCKVTAGWVLGRCTERDDLAPGICTCIASHWLAVHNVRQRMGGARIGWIPNLTWLGSLGEWQLAAWLPESEAEASEAEQHHCPGGGFGDAWNWRGEEALGGTAAIHMIPNDLS